MFFAAPAAASLISKSPISVSLKTPSETRAARVLPGVVSNANGGNLVGVAILDTRRSIGIAKENEVWAGGYAQVSASVLSDYLPLRSRVIATIPPTAQASPEDAAKYVANNRITADQLRAQSGAGPDLVPSGLMAPSMTGKLGIVALILLGVVVAFGMRGKKAVAA